MENYKRKKITTKADNETLLLEQIKHLNTLIEKLESKPSTDGNKGLKVKIGKLQFTKKEIRKMPRLKDFSIRQKENGVYEIRFRRYGYNESFSSKDFSVAKQKAFMWLSEFESQIKPNVHFTVLSQSESERFSIGKNTLFKTFADDYIYNVRKRRVKALTFMTYKNYYESEILPVYGKMRLSDIKPYYIQKHLDKLHAAKPRSCEDIKMLLNGIFQYAVDNGIIDRNPIKAVYIEKHERKNGVALTPDEERQFVKDIKGSKNEWVFLKMLYSGVRPSEISDIQEDIENNTLTIKNAKLKSYQKNLTRTIPIFPKYKETLDHPIRKYVYLHDLGSDLKYYLPNHTLKDLRHTFTTRARECGIDNELVAVWTGHSLGNITRSVYTHFSNEFQQEQAKKLNY